MSKQVDEQRDESILNQYTLDSLYYDFVKHYYENDDRESAAPLVSRLETLLADSPDYSNTIRGEEIRSLIAQFRGNLSEAIQNREAEIRKILELHALTVNTPSWEYISRKYGFHDVSDRLDLLAILYDEQGELDRAIAVLLESKQYCESHNIPFDATDLLEELEHIRTSRVIPLTHRNGSRDELDDVIRRVYLEFNTVADEIVVVEKLSRKFTQQVNRLLSEKMIVSVQDIKRRLLALRRRGEARGGLPRLRR
jgi:DNA polymerase III delta prime subunit